LSADRRTSGDADLDVEVEAALRNCDRPAARAEFCDELRRRFLDAAGAQSSSRRRVGSRTVWLLAAVVILAAGYFLLRPSTPEWRVLEVAPGSVVQADGVSVPVEDRMALARALQNAHAIFVESGDVIVRAGDLSLFDIGAGTHVEFAGFHPDERPGPLLVRASSGRLRARTGPGFPGRMMEVLAGSMEVAVTGTAFAVDYEEAGTCVCCLHGTVEVKSQAVGAEAMAVQPGKMCLVFRDDRAPLWGDSPEAHAQPLGRLEARAREIWP